MLMLASRMMQFVSGLHQEKSCSTGKSPVQQHRTANSTGSKPRSFWRDGLFSPYRSDRVRQIFQKNRGCGHFGMFFGI